MLISIDYDDTFTAKPYVWQLVIDLLRDHGHTVICTSAKYESENNRREVERALPNTVVLLTSSTPKKEYALKHGYDVEIWIDDLPQSIPSTEELKAMYYA